MNEKEQPPVPDSGFWIWDEKNSRWVENPNF